MTSPRTLVVCADFYSEISAYLVEDAFNTLRDLKIEEYNIQHVPGVFEIPTMVAMHHEKFDLVVALGTVIRGETSHYDLITQSVTNALQTIAWQNKIALGFGIITAENHNQAMERADPRDEYRVGKRAVEAAHLLWVKSKGI